MTEHWSDNLYEPDVWVSADGPVRVEDMTAAHAARAYQWALRQAENILIREQFSMATGPQPSGDMACDAFDSALSELEQHSDDPEAWLAATPLLRALGVRGGLVEPESAEPEDDKETGPMDDFEAYGRRQQTVRALRFAFPDAGPDNFQKGLGPFVEATTHQVPGPGRGLQTILRIRSLKQTVEVPVGDWLLVEGDRFWHIDDDEFRRDYSPDVVDAEILCYCGSSLNEGNHELCYPGMD